jgi:hypothetical protein
MSLENICLKIDKNNLQEYRRLVVVNATEFPFDDDWWDWEYNDLQTFGGSDPSLRFGEKWDKEPISLTEEDWKKLEFGRDESFKTLISEINEDIKEDCEF